MPATVLVRDDRFELLYGSTPIGARRSLDAAALGHLESLAARYALLEQRPDPAAAYAIGRDLYRWIEGDQRLLSRWTEQAVPPLVLSIHCPIRRPSPVEWALLRAPWELLADDAAYLATDPLLQFSPQRRLGPLHEPAPLDDYRLGLAFMAAAPQGVSELDYEAEEAAILDAVGHTHLDLLVDESGEAEALGRRLAEAGAVPVLHLSCHGHHAWREPPEAPPRPVLLLEDGAFGQRPTDAAALLGALRPAPPRLLFLSACLTAAAPGREADPRAALPPQRDSKQPDGGPGPRVGDSPAHSLASALIQAGLPAIIGWDGSVADTAATRFAAELYRRLANREALALAVAEARRALLTDPDEPIRRNWHLARLWLGSGGDGTAPLVAGARKRSLLPADHLHKDFLGKEVPVASHALFVGRRRELQQALRVLHAGEHAGVLLTGMGRLGKSSLAARIANRRRDDLALAVLHGRFGPLEVLEKLDAALAPYPAARDRVRNGQARVRAELPHGEAPALQALGDLLTDLLRGPCQQRDADGPALLCVLDDFEQLLEEAARVQARHTGLVTTLLRAFDPAATDSRLLITSRFPFRLEQGGEDLAARLARIELSSFKETAERKLTLRQHSAAQALGLADLAAREAQLPRARAAARGNPGLLDLLVARLLLNPVVPLAEAEAALTEMAGYLAGGDLPASEPVRELLENIAVETLLKLAGPAGKGLLQALTLFELPLPRTVAEQLAQAIGVSPLAAGRVAPLGTADQAAIAGIVTQPLFAAWGGERALRPALADLELSRLALAGREAAIAAACGAGAVRALEADSYQAAAALGQDLLRLLEGAALPTPPPLLAAAARVIGAAGDGETAYALLAKGVAAFEARQDADAQDVLPLLDAYASRLYRRGQLDEALRIRTEEELPVYERLGDVRSLLVCRAKIAITLLTRMTQTGAREDAAQANTLLCQALADARRLRLPEAGQIEQILEQARMDCDPKA